MTYKIRFFSDLHNEFNIFDIPKMPDDKDTLLILAGDIAVGKRKGTYTEFLADAVERFRKIIYIAGNHEYYGGSWYLTWDSMQKEMVERLKDQGMDAYLHMINNRTIIDGDVAIIGATLWTDYDNRNPMSMEAAKMAMNDYQVIRRGHKADPYAGKFSPMDALMAHDESRDFIFAEIRKHKAAGKKVVVVTHHGPSRMSIHDDYKMDNTNGAYVTEFGYKLLELTDEGLAPEFWIHGHVHNSFDYTIGNTRIMTNPRGYVTYNTPNGENRAFDPYKVIDL